MVTRLQGQYLEILSAVIMDLGECIMQAWHPILSYKEASRYQNKAEKFSQDFIDALPKLERLPIYLNTRAPTFNPRFEMDNAMYKRVEMGPISARSFALATKMQSPLLQNCFL